MPETNKIQRDQATILAIIKYVLIAALVVGVIYISFKLFVLLLPFVAGLVLARTSIALANRLHPWRKKNTAIIHPGNEHPARKNADKAALHNPVADITAVPDEPVTDDILAEVSAVDQDDIPDAPPALLNIRWAVAFYAILVVALIALVAGVIFASITQLRELSSYITKLVSENNLGSLLLEPLRSLEGLLGNFLDDNTLLMIENALIDWQNGLVNAIPSVASAVLNGLGGFVSSLPAVFLTIIVILLSGFYFITDSANLYRFLDRSINNKSFLDKTVGLFNILSKTLLRVIGGYMLLLIITFILVLIGLLIIRMPYAVIFALVAAIVDFLPVLGISATMIPIAIYMFINGQIWSGVGALIIFAAVTMIRRFIEPPILGNALRLHPMATLFSMIVGVAAYGLGGILVGPVLMVIAKEIMGQFGFDKKIRKITGDVLTRILD